MDSEEGVGGGGGGEVGGIDGVMRAPAEASRATGKASDVVRAPGSPSRTRAAAAAAVASSPVKGSASPRRPGRPRGPARRGGGGAVEKLDQD